MPAGLDEIDAAPAAGWTVAERDFHDRDTGARAARAIQARLRTGAGRAGLLLVVCMAWTEFAWQQDYEAQQRQRSVAALRRRAADFGFAIAPLAPAA